MAPTSDTIFALSTADGRSGIAIVRLSGSHSASLLQVLSRQAPPAPRRAALRHLTHNDIAIDTALILRFVAPASFTGEDMVEFLLHGGHAVHRSLALALEDLGARRAEPGEFSRRAFLNGKIDLTEAEAIADLIDAETTLQQAHALQQAGGALSRLYQEWSERLVKFLAYMEASLDFPDEDLPVDFLLPLQTEVAALTREIQDHLTDIRRGERLRHGVSVAIIGPPNAGKSSLINSLAERDVAIVSARAGTTRDVIEVHLDLGGYPVILADTAGLHVSDSDIESEGMRRALERAAQADITILLFDSTILPDPELLKLQTPQSIMVWNKWDLVPDFDPPYGMALSVATGQGMIEFLTMLTARVAECIGSPANPMPNRERHRSHLLEATRALTEFAVTPAPDLATECLRLALRSLGRITGKVDPDAMLDVIFRDFCIGK